ncbi:MAG: hypothetical protein K0S86_2614 [Geminicoccaceae bacterium]|nr:hypothetical protein [Geminicoccaceae bacterium]
MLRAVLAALALVTATLRAQERPRPEITGSLRGGYWSSTRELDRRHPLGSGMAWLKSTAQMPGHLTLFAEGWVAVRGPVDDADATAELREAYVTVALGNLDVRAGRQILAWGRADGVNPTGNLAAEDLTLLTPDDADRRLGATAATVSYYLGGLSISGVWLPEFRGHRIALPDGGGMSFDETKRAWPGDQWALRAEHTGGAVDWSASFFRGLDLSPDLEPAVIPSGGPKGRSRGIAIVPIEGPAGEPNVVELHHRRVHVFGADAATTFGRYGLRAEGAYVRTEDGPGTDPFSRNPFVFVVLGGDRTFDGRLNVNVQYLGRAVVRFHRPPGDLSPDVAAVAQGQAVLSSQTRRVQHGASMRASYKWLHETLETEWAAVAYAGPRGVAMRPKVTYAVTDRFTLLAGAEVYRGEDASVFGLLRPNSTAFLEARVSFRAQRRRSPLAPQVGSPK